MEARWFWEPEVLGSTPGYPTFTWPIRLVVGREVFNLVT